MHSQKIVDYWQTRSKLEKKLILLVIILVIVLVILFCYLSLVKSPGSDLCTSVECVEAANHILEYIDPTVDPCDDFHQFICGSFLQKAEDHNKPSAIQIMKERTKNQISAVIMEDPKKATTHSLKLQRQFYQSCMNESAIEEDDNMTFLKLLDDLGGWPIIKGRFWEANTFDWTFMMVKSKKMGVAFERFIEVGVDDKENSTDKRQIRITYPRGVETIPPEIIDGQTELIRDIAVILHAPSIGSLVELKNVVNFQNNLSQIIQKAQKSSEKQIELTVEELESKFGRIQWQQFLNNLLDGVIHLEKSDKVLFDVEQYLIDLDNLLSKVTKRTQGNYIIWKIIEKNIPFLTKEIRDRFKKFQNQYYPKDSYPNRSRKETCLQYAKELFKDVAEIEYVKKHTDPLIKQEILNIFNEVKEKLIGKLTSTERLSIQLKPEVIEEIKNTTIDIGGSDVIYDEEKTEKFLGYSQLSFKDDNLINMITSIGKVTINNIFAGVEDFLKLEQFFLMAETYTSVNAFYVSQFNRLILPVTLLQDVMYNKKRPQYMNYGSLVSSIGHEFTHSLIKLGNTTYVRKNRFFFTYNDAFFNAFGNSSQCFQDEFDDFVATSNIRTIINAPNSNDTLEENIADFLGTSLAYELYEDFVNKNGEEARLPGLNLTPKQIFWIMTGTFMCEKNQAHKDQILHAGLIYRINYRLRNLPEFARDFDCPIDSFMNPSRKCRIF